jgi:hypothetical protein
MAAIVGSCIRLLDAVVSAGEFDRTLGRVRIGAVVDAAEVNDYVGLTEGGGVMGRDGLMTRRSVVLGAGRRWRRCS